MAEASRQEWEDFTVFICTHRCGQSAVTEGRSVVLGEVCKSTVHKNDECVTRAFPLQERALEKR